MKSSPPLHAGREATTRDIPIIFLTAKASVEDEELGLKLGAVDYITKPISPPVVLARVKTHLNLKASADFLRSKSDFLEQEVAKRTREVNAIQDVTILAMASGSKPATTRPATISAGLSITSRSWLTPWKIIPVLPLTWMTTPSPCCTVGATTRHWQSRHSRSHLAQPGRFEPAGIRRS